MLSILCPVAGVSLSYSLFPLRALSKGNAYNFILFQRTYLKYSNTHVIVSDQAYNQILCLSCTKCAYDFFFDLLHLFEITSHEHLPIFED